MIQRALTRFYERHSAAGLLVVAVVWSYLFCVISFGLLVLAAAARYHDVPFSRMVPYLPALAVGLAVAIAIGGYLTREEIRTALSWSSTDGSGKDPVAVWRAAQVGPRLVVSRAAIASYVFVMICLPIFEMTFDGPLWVVIPNAVVWALLISAFAVFVLLSCDFLFRPFLRDVADHLPSGVKSPPRTLSLRTKALLPVPGAIAFAVLMTGAYVDTTADYPTRTTVALGLSLVGGAMAVAVFLLLTHAALDPIDELTAATQRVRAGDLSAPVPVISADEFGALAASFNEMLEGLRERESLREHNVELLEDVRASRARIVATADGERRRMERDLHDGAQQRLVLINLKLGMARDLVTSDPARAAAVLDELRADAGRAVDELRDLAHGIYPPLLESDGLAAALEDVADQSSLDIAVDSDGIRRYAPELEAAVYFCCLEALQNATKHAGDGSHVDIGLAEDDGQLQFSVTDNGRGFDPARVNGSAGIQNMTDRIGALGGTVHIDSTPGHGTTVEGTVPL